MEAPGDRGGATVRARSVGVLALVGLIVSMAIAPTAAVAADAFPATACSEFGVTPPPADQKDTKGQPITPRPAEGKKSVPVILVHGWNGNAGTFSSPISLFADTGDGGDGMKLPFSFIGQLQSTPGLAVYTFDYSAYSDRWVDDGNIGGKLAGAIECLTNYYGTKAQIVAHSMGGLATRYALGQNDSSGAKVSNRVSGVSTFGTPNTGSAIATAVASSLGLDSTLPPSTTNATGAAGIAGWLLAYICGRQITAGTNSLPPPCNLIPSWAAGLDSDASKAMRVGSSQLSSLPPWPSGMPVTAIDGKTLITGLSLFGAPGSTPGVDVGDVLVPPSSATAGSTATRDLNCSYELGVQGATSRLILKAFGSNLVANGPIFAILGDNPCFHANLLRTINGTNVAADAVRAAASNPQAIQTTTNGVGSSDAPTSTATSSGSAGPAWYYLQDIGSISAGNGLDYKESLTIRNSPFPKSLLGWYNTTEDFAADADQMTFGLKGLCTRFEVFVGQSADSPGRVGPSTFIVMLDGKVAANVQRVYLDEPQKIDLDVTGVTRLEIQDIRTNETGGNNVWGSPRFYCSSSFSPN